MKPRVPSDRHHEARFFAVNDVELAELEDFAIELAHTAGRIAKTHFRKSFSIENKGGDAFDPVTSADQAIERVLRTRIAERFPDHGIVGEEEGVLTTSSPYRWYIDPIDGTRAFMTGSPLWGTLVGLVRHDTPVFGLMCQPVLGEVFLGGAAGAGGAWLVTAESRERLATRSTRALGAAVLASTHPALFGPAESTSFERLAAQCLMTRFGGDCYNYAMLAAGFIDLVVEAQLKPFDIVPLIPILEAAGAIVTDWRGGNVLDGGTVVAAATPELHRAALAVLQG